VQIVLDPKHILFDKGRIKLQSFFLYNHKDYDAGLNPPETKNPKRVESINNPKLRMAWQLGVVGYILVTGVVCIQDF
jgi:hypothetical protein